MPSVNYLPGSVPCIVGLLYFHFNLNIGSAVVVRSRTLSPGSNLAAAA